MGKQKIISLFKATAVLAVCLKIIDPEGDALHGKVSTK